LNLFGDTEDEGQKDRLLKKLQACADLYHDLLEDWREWKGATRIKNLDVRSVLIERIEKLLY
jgi:hypothetical protein